MNLYSAHMKKIWIINMSENFYSLKFIIILLFYIIS